MTSDGNRGAVLTYNDLNFPKTVAITGKTLTYDYDAAGTNYYPFGLVIDRNPVPATKAV